MFWMVENASSFKKTMIIGIVVGVISGIGAFLFFSGLKLGTHFVFENLMNYHYPIEGQSLESISEWAPPATIWLILPIICMGALLSGLLVYNFAPEAEGHGTDAAIKAFHGEGRIRWRVPIIKALASILTISTGGSAGREGPTAQISAGFGSIAADALKLSPRERRIALATGIGAGIGTIFKAPLGGAILAAEILYTRDFESDVIMPSFLASIIGYSIFGFFEGYDPIFGTASIHWEIPQIPLFLVLGIICALVGLLYIRVFYGTKKVFADFFEKKHLPVVLKPVTGAFFIGVFVIVFSYICPETMITALASLGTGYGFMQLAIYNMLPLAVLVLLPFTKIFTTSFTIGSGGSGGVFAPGLAIGGAAGGAFGMILHIFLPQIVPLFTIPAFVIVGMISLFGGIANAPIAVMIMVVEMTSDFSLLVPAMGAVAVSTVLTGESTIFREQLRTKAQSPAHRGEYQIEILNEISAESAMRKAGELICLSPQDSWEKVMNLMDSTHHTGFPVIDNGKLVGIVTYRDVWPEDNKLSSIGEIMKYPVITIPPDSNLEKALIIMMEKDIHHLPVTDKDNPDKVLGFITSTDIMRSYTKAVNLTKKSK
ncbi:CIC family chloride channel protein [Methanomicrobium sp. W14]|uniref:chloride channel protein n=1 Tax=Methanomicrobium sp. W14 TaxID=2817839 RepID=UPI001AE40AD1|nr:chloride channel protein [Methanomicrobium sp. W14]MBP2132679.1 CIC family chloride channel protein [Methanomicrobium sp. W14]